LMGSGVMLNLGYWGIRLSYVIDGMWLEVA